MGIGFWIILTACLVGANCSLIGNFLVLRSEAMLADAISHSIFLGIVLSFLITNSLDSFAVFIGASLVGILTAFCVTFISERFRLAKDVSIGITFTGFCALGVVLASLYTKKVDLDVECVLHGELIMVPFDVWIYQGMSLGPKVVYFLLGLLLFNVFFVWYCYPTLVITSFDPVYATSLGIYTRLWYYLVMGITSMSIVVACKTVGAILSVAFFVIPPATAYLLTESLDSMISYSLLINILMVLGGYFLAFWLDNSVSGAMVTVGGCLFGLAFVASRYRNT